MHRIEAYTRLAIIFIIIITILYLPILLILRKKRKNIIRQLGKLGVNALEVRKHIYDYVITDFTIEMEFARKLEQGEVTIYAKLPNGFKEK